MQIYSKCLTCVMAQYVTQLSSKSVCLVFLAGGLYALQSIQTISNTKHIENWGQSSLNHNIKKTTKATSGVPRKVSQDGMIVLGRLIVPLKSVSAIFFLLWPKRGTALNSLPDSHVAMICDFGKRKAYSAPGFCLSTCFMLISVGIKKSFREFIWLSILIFIKHVG